MKCTYCGFELTAGGCANYACSSKAQGTVNLSDLPPATYYTPQQIQLDRIEAKLDQPLADLLGEALDEKYKLQCRITDELLPRITELEAQLAAVRPYLRHTEDCEYGTWVGKDMPVYDRCICGLKAAIGDET